MPSDNCPHHRAVARWKNFIEQASKQPVNPVDITLLPIWFDKQRFLEAQINVQQHEISANFSMMCGLIILLQLPRILVTLVQTGKSDSIPSLFYRYLDTARHIRAWTYGDIFDPESEAFKSMSTVRKLHSTAFKKMESVDNKPEGTDWWTSQYGMVVTQWAFIGFGMLFPEKCGLHGDTRKVREDINVMWRAFGYALGIKDEYNLCRESLDETLEYCELILDNLYIPVMRKTNPRVTPLGLQMGQDVLTSIEPLRVGVTVTGHVVQYYWMTNLGIEPDFQLSWREKWQLKALKFMMSTALKYKLVVSIGRRAAKRRLHAIQKKREKVHENLQKKYPEVKYTPQSLANSECPFSHKFLSNGEV